MGQLSQVQLDDQALARVRGLAALEGIPSPATDALRRRLSERELADNATRHAKREIPTDLYLAEHARISPELDALETSSSVSPAVDAEDAVAALRNLAAAWRNASEEAQAQLIRAVYARISVDGERVVSVELTPEAYRTDSTRCCPRLCHWRARQESNPRPDGPKPPALSAELRARVSRSNRAEN